MRDLAGRCEGAGDGDEDDLLILELCPPLAPISSYGLFFFLSSSFPAFCWSVLRTFAGVELLGGAAARDVAVLWCVGDVAEGYALGEAIADLETRHDCGWGVFFEGVVENWLSVSCSALR